MKIKVLQLHKRGSIKYKYIQDRYAIDPSNTIIGLADGTTQSFQSEIWSEKLTEKFVQNPSLEKNSFLDLLKTAAQEHQQISFKFSENPAKASLEKAKKKKGSTATFLGVQLISKDRLKTICCGDTNLFLINTKNQVTAFPFSDVDSLDSSSSFINTENLLKNEFDEDTLFEKEFAWNPNDKLVLATDALSRLILKDPKVLSELMNISDFKEFHSFCESKWKDKILEEDDITAIVVKNEADKSLKKIIPPSDFAFPRELKPEFKPTSLTNNSDSNNFSDMQLHQLMNQFSGVNSNFQQIKQKLKSHQLLLLATIILLTFNLAFTYVYRKSETSDNKSLTEEEYRKTLQGKDTEIKNLRTQNLALEKKVSELKNDALISQADGKKSEITEEEPVKIKPSTPEEVKAFQIKVGLNPDGQWGPKSEKAWENLSKK